MTKFKMFHNFDCHTADHMWGIISQAFSSSDLEWANVTGRDNKQTKEILHATISISDPRQRWVQTRFKAINIALSIAEVVWIINGRQDSAFIKAFFPRISEYAGNAENFHGAYGHRLRSHFQVGDQLHRAYHALKSQPTTRQVVLSIWDPNIDMPDLDGSAKANDIPCNISSLLKVRDGKLEWLQIMRSNDVHKGLPNNIVQFTSLHEIMAGWLGLEIGSYNHVSDSLHVYEDDFDLIIPNEDSSIIENTDRLDSSFDHSKKNFSIMAHTIDQMLDTALTAYDVMEVAIPKELPEAYSNMMHVLKAEILRRKNALKEAQSEMEHCSNQLFLKLWNRWMYREHQEWAFAQNLANRL